MLTKVSERRQARAAAVFLRAGGGARLQLHGLRARTLCTKKAYKKEAALRAGRLLVIWMPF